MPGSASRSPTCSSTSISWPAAGLGRMLPLMLAHGMTLGVGVEEDSAAILRGDVVEVLGAGALLVDLADAATDAKLGAFNLSNARLTYLGHGDRYDLRTRTLIRPPAPSSTAS